MFKKALPAKTLALIISIFLINGLAVSVFVLAASHNSTENLAHKEGSTGEVTWEVLSVEEYNAPLNSTDQFPQVECQSQNGKFVVVNLHINNQGSTVVNFENNVPLVVSSLETYQPLSLNESYKLQKCFEKPLTTNLAGPINPQTTAEVSLAYDVPAELEDFSLQVSSLEYDYLQGSVE